MPVSGTISAINTELETAPELVNDDPYGDGWMVELELADEEELEALMDADTYADTI
jgi:glycine cleavage system H protein